MKYLIWMQSVLLAGNNKVNLLLSRFGSAKGVYEARKGALIESGILSNGELSRAVGTDISSAENIIEKCAKNGIRTVGFYDGDYPESLRNIPNPPLVLYTKGKMPDFNSMPAVCVVGPRKVSDFGYKSSYSLASRLSKAGIVVISGGAKGADRAAHIGAIKSGGITVAVLPCGILNGYLKENAALRERIAQTGCLISEYPPYSPVTGSSFKVRNRLLAGLAHSTIVVEAEEGSGALITANYALDYGRELFVIPGNPTYEQYKGSNVLIRDGARPLLGAADIFDEYKAHYGDKIDLEKAYRKSEPQAPKGLERKTVKIQKNLPSGLSKTAEMLYNNLDKQKFSADDLLEFGFSDDELLSAITELELEHLIKATAGGFYEKTD